MPMGADGPRAKLMGFLQGALKAINLPVVDAQRHRHPNAKRVIGELVRYVAGDHAQDADE